MDNLILANEHNGVLLISISGLNKNALNNQKHLAL